MVKLEESKPNDPTPHFRERLSERERVALWLVAGIVVFSLSEVTVAYLNLREAAAWLSRPASQG